MNELNNAMEFRAFVRRSPKMTHAEYITRYLEEYGSITQLEATYGFGCTRLAARIADLRKNGMDIVSERASGDSPYAIYSIRKEN